MIETYHCPSCSVLLHRSGIVTVGGEDLPTFQCDTCTKHVLMFGEQVKVALTFLVNGKGEAIDPAD